MLWKLVGVATLAVGVFGHRQFEDPYNRYPADDPYDATVRQYCKAMHTEHNVSEVKSSIETFYSDNRAGGLFDETRADGDMEAARASGNYDTVIRKYCGKMPQLKDYLRDLAEGISPCLPPEMPAASLKIANTVIDFVCDNDGARASSFIKEGGLQCINGKDRHIGLCLDGMSSNFNQLMNTDGGGVAGSRKMFKKEACSIIHQGLTCAANALKACSNPTPGRLAQEFHDVVLKSIYCSEVRTDLNNH